MNARSALGACAATLGLLAAASRCGPPASRSTPPGPPFRVRGAPHVHTAFSADATGTVEDVVRAARACGLQFVMITDHNTQAALAQQGYREGVLVLVGLEKSTDAGHAIVLGTGPLPFGLDGDPYEVARDAATLGGFVVVAHPASPDRELRWTDGWDGVDGMEVLNFGQPGSWPRPGPGAAPLLARYLLDPTSALLHGFAFSRDALALWDAQLARRPLAGLLGTDAHGGLRVGRTVVPLPPHQRVFALASEHLLLPAPLTGDAARDGPAVLDAFRHGRGYVAVDALADASAFSFTAANPSGRAGPGEDLPFAAGTRLTARSGGVSRAELVLLRDGQPLARGAAIDAVAEGPGVYRVEGFVRGAITGRGRDPLPWVLANPVYLFPPDELRARAARAALPSPAAPPAGPLEALDTFAGPLGAEWQVEGAEGAEAAVRIEGRAVRFDFALGPHAPTHADLVRWKEADLSGAAALAVRVRADRRLRFDLQVRTAWPGHGAAVRIWRRSVRAEAEWTAVSIPLEALETYDRQPGSPDLAHVVGLYVHVDEANLPPRARGTIWIDELALVPTR